MIEAVGALLVCDGTRIIARSSNAAAVLGQAAATAEELGALVPESLIAGVTLVREREIRWPVRVDCADFDSDFRYACWAHIEASGATIVELQPLDGAEPDRERDAKLSEAGLIEAGLIEALGEGAWTADTVDRLLAELRRCSGFERVVLSRLTGDGHLVVVGEANDGRGAPWLGHYFPADWFPREARDALATGGPVWVSDLEQAPIEVIGGVGAGLTLGRARLCTLPRVFRSLPRALDLGAVMLAGVGGAELLGMLSFMDTRTRRVPPGLRDLVHRARQVIGSVWKDEYASHGRAAIGRQSELEAELLPRLASATDILRELIHGPVTLATAIPNVDAHAVVVGERVVASTSALEPTELVSLCARANACQGSHHLVELTLGGNDQQPSVGVLLAGLPGRAGWLLWIRKPRPAPPAASDAFPTETPWLPGPLAWTAEERRCAARTAQVLGGVAIAQIEWLRERCDMLERLIRRAELLDLAISATGHAVLACDVVAGQPRISYAGGAFERLTGYTADEAMGRNPRFLQGPETSAETRAQLRAAIADHRPIDARILNYRKNGETWWVEFNMRPIPVTSDGVYRFVAVQRDAFTQMEVEEGREQAGHARLLEKLARGLAHDMNNLLMVITTSLSLFADDPRLDDEDHLLLRSATHAVTRGQLMITSLQTMAQRSLPVAGRELTANDEIRQIAALLRGSIPDGVELRFDLDGDTRIHADPGLLQAALLNLLLNANHAVSRGGQVVIRTRSRVDLDGRAVVEVEVEDDGVGMDEHTLANATEPFFSTRADRGGSGLGLAMVRRFVEVYAGSLTIRAKPGQGTRVCLAFPGLPCPA